MNESARPNAFSFTADIAGTHLDAAVAVHSLDSETPSDDQIDFGHELVQRVMDAAAEYEPAEAARTETLDAYVILANTHQLIALARNSADETPSQAMRYFEDAAANLEILAEWDPRFTTAYHRVRQGEQLTGNTPVEFYIQLAHAKQLCFAARTERFAADGVYRRNVLEALSYSLSVMSSFDPVYATPLKLARVAEELNEDISGDEVVKVASAIEGWLPREMAELIPEGWDGERSEELGGWLEHGLNVLPGGRFVAVFDKQTAEDFRETGLPDPAKLVPVVVGEEADPRLFGLPNAQVFLADI